MQPYGVTTLIWRSIVVTRKLSCTVVWLEARMTTDFSDLKCSSTLEFFFFFLLTKLKQLNLAGKNQCRSKFSSFWGNYSFFGKQVKSTSINFQNLLECQETVADYICTVRCLRQNRQRSATHLINSKSTWLVRTRGENLFITSCWCREVNVKKKNLLTQGLDT